MNRLNRKYQLIIIILFLSFNNELAYIEVSATSDFQEPMKYWPTTGWLSSTPEAQGMVSAKLEQIKYRIQYYPLPIHSVVVIRNGYIVYELYPTEFTQDTLHSLYSVTKSFTSTLIGIAIQNGFINSTDDKVVDFFPERSIKNLDSRKQEMTLEHLLTMSAGLQWDEWSYPYFDSRNDYFSMIISGDCIQYVLDQPMVNTPGTEFAYNTGISHLLSAIIQQTTGFTTLEFAKKFLFTPLGISDAQWVRDSQGIYFGGSDLFLNSRDMAKLGYLYLNEGFWDNKSVISEEWVSRSTTGFSTTPFNSSYGYHWWVWESKGFYFANGVFGQNIFVIPKENMIVVFTASFNEDGFDLEYQLLQDYILPAIASDSPLITDENLSLLDHKGIHLVIVVTLTIILAIKRKI